jgi:CheY-like chemotaxis protein
LTIAAFCLGFVSLGNAEDQKATSSPDKKVQRKADATANADLRAKIHRTMAELIEARADDEPDQARIDKLARKLQQLRAKLAAEADGDQPAWTCPWGGPGRGWGRGAAWGGGGESKWPTVDRACPRVTWNICLHPTSPRACAARAWGWPLCAGLRPLTVGRWATRPEPAAGPFSGWMEFMADELRTILVVDDEAEQRRLLGGFVQSLGFRVEEASSAEDALAAIRTRTPDMVLLDVRLPGMSGIEALAEIRRMAERLPVLLITAYADLRQAVAAMKSGADDYLAKPVDLDELEAAISDALGRTERTPGDRSLPELPP